jgi:hypothetical protein
VHCRPVGQVEGGEDERDLPLGPGLQADLGERLQLAGRPGYRSGRVADVHLDDLLPGAAAGVRDRAAHGHGQVAGVRGTGAGDSQVLTGTSVAPAGTAPNAPSTQ